MSAEKETSGAVEPKDRHHYAAAWLLVAEAAEETAAQMWPGMMDGKEALEMFASRIRVNSKFITATRSPQERANPSPPHAEQSTTRLSASTPTSTETNSNEIP